MIMEVAMPINDRAGIESAAEDFSSSSADGDDLDEHGARVARPECELNEEQVRRDREAGRARTEQARAQLKAQEAVMSRIHAKLAENGDFDALSPNTGTLHSGRGPAKASRLRSPSPPVAEGTGSPTQRENARVVSQLMMRRQDRTEAFQKRRRAVTDEDRQKREQAALDLQASDARSISKQKQSMDEQKHKSFKAQQRRNEQQKAFRESEREQEHAWEAYYAKQYSWANKSPRPSPRPGASKSVPSLPPADTHRGKSAPSKEPSSDVEDDIFRSTMQSHNLYNDTLERWTGFVKENDKRTEAHRRKVMMGSGLSPFEREASDSSKNRKFRATVTSIKLANLFGGQASHSLPELPKLEDSPKAASNGTMTADHRDYLPSIDKWESRKEQCNKHCQEQDQLAQERIHAKAENLQEARQRIDAHNQERAKKALENNKQWEQRNDVSVKKRAEGAVRTDVDLVRKQEEQNRRRLEIQQKERDDRMGQSTAKMQIIHEAQDKVRARLDESAEKGKQKIELKQITTEQNYTTMLKEFADKADSPKYTEEARAKHQKKVDLDENFRDRTKQEIELKALKSTHNLAKKKQPGLQKQRALKKDKSLSDSSPKIAATLKVSESFSIDADEVIQSPLDGCSEASPSNHVSVLPPLANPVTRAATRSKPVADSDSEHEEVFLQDLEERSVKWMHDMRKQKENSVGRWKP